jgi:hypothetical protein
MKFIKDFFKNRKLNKLKKKIERLQQDALHLQRNGKLRLYASVMSEIEELSDKLTENVDNEKLSYEPPPNDFVDYDGMGNQGRFPEAKKK